MVVEYSESIVRSWLKEVMDPEIPVLSLVDLGVIGAIDLQDKKARIELRPTFVGCPAIHQMKSDVESMLYSKGFEEVEVDIGFKSPWSSDMISDDGREALRKFGYAPPPKGGLIDDIDVLEHVECPQCGGDNTELTTPFGPTLCRSIHFCNDCSEAFQGFKPLSND